MKRDGLFYLILIGLIVLCGLRLVHISADPPVSLSWSGGLFFDEGALAHNARSKVLFGEWELDEWNDYYYSPILTYIKWLVFSLLGVGLAQVRLVPIVFSWLTLWLFYLSLRMSRTRQTAFLGTLLLGSNYIFLMYNRLGLTETPLIFFTVLTLYFWQKGFQARGVRAENWFMLLTGASCFMVYIFKALLIYFLPVPFVGLLALWIIAPDKAQRRRILRFSAFFLLGFVVTTGLWLALFYYPNYDVINQAGDYVKALSLPRSLNGLFENIVRTPFLTIFSQSPLIVALSLLYFFFPCYLVIHKRAAEIKPLDIFVGLWYLAHLFFFLGYAYRPTRYYTPILPPMAALTALLLGNLAETTSLKFSQKISGWFWGICWILGSIFGAFILIPLLYRYGAIPIVTVPEMSVSARLLPAGLLAFLIIGGFAWLNRRSRQQPLRIHPLLTKAVIGFLLLGSLSVNGILYWRWAAAPQYTVRDTSRELGRLLNQAFIAGLATPALCLENSHRPLYVWENFTNYQDTLEKYQITHLFLAEFNREVGYYQQKFPQLMKRAVLLKTYQIKGSRFHLFSVVEPAITEVAIPRSTFSAEEQVAITLNVKNNDPQQRKTIDTGWVLQSREESGPSVTATATSLSFAPEEQKTVRVSKQVPPGSYDLMTGIFKPEQELYEAEALSSQIGNTRPDVHASKGQARHVDAAQPGYMVYGPYHGYPSGKFETDFTLKYEGVAQDEPLAILDIATDTGRTVLARKTLYARDFEKSDSYQTFRLSYILKTEAKLEFRIYNPGNVALWADTIRTHILKGTWHSTPITVTAAKKSS